MKASLRWPEQDLQKSQSGSPNEQNGPYMDGNSLSLIRCSVLLQPEGHQVFSFVTCIFLRLNHFLFWLFVHRSDFVRFEHFAEGILCEILQSPALFIFSWITFFKRNRNYLLHINLSSRKPEKNSSKTYKIKIEWLGAEIHFYIWTILPLFWAWYVNLV
jgi:hypothetical protein